MTKSNKTKQLSKDLLIDLVGIKDYLEGIHQDYDDSGDYPDLGALYQERINWAVTRLDELIQKIK
jgi:hypothetical protein